MTTDTRSTIYEVVHDPGHDGDRKVGAHFDELALEDFAGHRSLVPSDRQARAGVQRVRLPQETPIRDIPTTGLSQAVLAERILDTDTEVRRSRIPSWVSALNPFGIEGPKMPLIVLSLSAMLGGWGSSALGIASPEIQATFGVSVVALTMIGAFQQSFMLIIGIPLGYLVDRVNRVRLIQIANFSSCIGDMISASARGYGTFLSGSIFSSVAGTPSSGADLPLLSDWYPTRSRARVFGFMEIAGLLGALISAPIVGLMIAKFGWRTATFTLSIIGLIVALLSLLLREPTRGRMDRLELTGSEERMENEPPPPTMTEALRGAWSIKTLRLQAIGGFVGTFSAPLTILLGLILASKFALGPFERSLISTLITICTFPALVLGMALADRMLATKPSSLVALQAGVGIFSSVVMIALSFAPNLPTFVILQTIGAVVPSVLGPISMTITSMVVPSRYRGVGMQVFTPFALVGSMLGPIMLATASKIDLQHAFLLFAPFMVISSLIILASAGSVTGDIRAARAAALAQRAAAGIPDLEGASGPILVARDLEASIGSAVLLASVDLDVHRGEILALTGTNGAGKSTLLKALCGLQPCTNGAVFYGGVDVTHLPAYELVGKGLAYIPGGQGILPDLSVRDNLHVALEHSRPAERLANELYDDALAHFPALATKMDIRASELSGGEQHMVALAQGLLLNPELLLIDELSLGLAPAMVETMMDTVRQIRDAGTTVVIVEQSLNLALGIADRIVYMDQGAVQFEGTPAELRDHPELLHAQFLGRPGARRVRPRTRKSADDGQLVLQARDLTIDYGGLRALDCIDIDVHAGEIIGLIGSNGAGKTTLFDALSVYQPLESGSVTLEGRDITTLSPDARARLGLARAFQSARLFGPLSVRETIAVALEKQADKNVAGAMLWLPSTRKKEKKLMERADALIDIFGLGAHANLPITSLSTGTRRAVEVACQLGMNPTVLLLDEPAGGLAQAEVEALGPALQRLVRDTGCGIVLIEHDLPLICSISDTLIAMDQGRVLASGSPADVLTNPDVLAGPLNASAEALGRSGSDFSALITVSSHATTTAPHSPATASANPSANPSPPTHTTEEGQS